MSRLRREHHGSSEEDGPGGRERRAARRDGQADAAELELARQLVERARAEGLPLTGPGGLLAGLTRRCWRPRWRAR